MCPPTFKFISHGSIPDHLSRTFLKWILGHLNKSFHIKNLKRFLLGFADWYFCKAKVPVKVALLNTQLKSKVEDPWSCLLTIKTVLYSVLVAKKWLLKWDTCRRLHVVYPVLDQCLQKLILIQINQSHSVLFSPIQSEQLTRTSQCLFWQKFYSRNPNLQFVFFYSCNCSVSR